MVPIVCSRIGNEQILLVTQRAAPTGAGVLKSSLIDKILISPSSLIRRSIFTTGAQYKIPGKSPDFYIFLDHPDRPGDVEARRFQRHPSSSIVTLPSPHRVQSSTSRQHLNLTCTTPPQCRSSQVSTTSCQPLNITAIPLAPRPVRASSAPPTQNANNSSSAKQAHLPTAAAPHGVHARKKTTPTAAHSPRFPSHSIHSIWAAREDVLRKVKLLRFRWMQREKSSMTLSRSRGMAREESCMRVSKT